MVCRDRNKWGSGVALYIHKSISADYAVCLDLMHYRPESLSVQIKLGNFRPFLITAIYLSDVSQESELLVNAIDKENKNLLLLEIQILTCLLLPIAIPNNVKRC